MAKKLELNFSSSKDAEIVRFIQLNENANTSPIFICALEYYIKTGNYLNIGKVCIKNVKESIKLRKPIYVPQNCIVEEWANEQKDARRGLLSTIVRHILKNSLEVVESESDEKIEDTTECMMKIQNLSRKPVEYSVKTIEPIVTSQHSSPFDNSGIHFSEPVITEKKESPPPKKSKSIMDKLMPVFDED